MKALSESTFSYEGIEAEVVFERNEDGEITGAVHTQGGDDLALKRLPPYDPSPEDLKMYEGRYFSEEVETFYEIKMVEEKLVVSLRNWEDIDLTPTEEGSFSGSVFFIGEMKFNIENGNATSFTVSNGRTKGVLFVRQ